MRGGFLWDDNAHVTRSELRSTAGLVRIWFDVGATQQYYPLLHSAFWIQHKLWGDRTIGYHTINVILHVCAAVLVMKIMQRLLMNKQVPWAGTGAFLTAMVFALHPVHVESVAWITELKNTLSAVFYLGAMLSYLRFDQSRRNRWYVLATSLFILGLLTKTVIATLPAGLLLIFWWQRGKLVGKRDVVPLLPWFVLGAAAGLFTAWVEHELIGAKGEAYDLSAVQRLLLLGRIVWFYLYKLAWPAELIFIYPRWSVQTDDWLQWLFPLALVVLLIVLAWACSKSRAPLAAALFFIGSLFPVLGFFNVYPFIYSYVADHFQYLASLGIISLVCCAIAAGLSRIPWLAVRVSLLFSLPLFLGMLSFGQSRMYADVQTLYRTTIQKNSECWMAYNNLGVVLKESGKYDQAIELYRRALEIHPTYSEAYNNLGVALNAMSQYDQAIVAYQKALELRPNNPQALGNLGNAYHNAGLDLQAVDSLQRALRLDPDNAVLHANLGVIFHATGQIERAIVEYRRALEFDPANREARVQMDLAQAAMRSGEPAIAAYQQVLRANPHNLGAHFSIAVLLAQKGRTAEAIEHYEQVIRIQPGHFEARNNVASLLARAGRLPEAIGHFEQAVRLKPTHIEMRMNLAMAYASAGRLQDAITTAEQASTMARSSQQTALVEKIEDRLAAFRTRAATTQAAQ